MRLLSFSLVLGRIPDFFIIKTRDTDDARIATSQTLGNLLNYLVSFIAGLALSFYHSWRLTLVILSSVPLITIIVSMTEGLAAPPGNNVRDLSAKASSTVDRLIGSMPTVKAFNASSIELEAFRKLTAEQHQVYCRQHFIWGIRVEITQFILLSMFVQGFWFGAYLVRTGKATAGSVSTCFWACLLATSFLQLALPMLRRSLWRVCWLWLGMKFRDLHWGINLHLRQLLLQQRRNPTR